MLVRAEIALLLLSVETAAANDGSGNGWNRVSQDRSEHLSRLRMVHSGVAVCTRLDGMDLSPNVFSGFQNLEDDGTGFGSVQNHEE